jgi:hypothetical protein
MVRIAQSQARSLFTITSSGLFIDNPLQSRWFLLGSVPVVWKQTKWVPPSKPFGFKKPILNIRLAQNHHSLTDSFLFLCVAASYSSPSTIILNVPYEYILSRNHQWSPN